MSDKIMGLSETLRALRLQRNLEQAELAYLMKVHVNSVQMMERYPDRVSVETLSKAAAIFDIAVWKILRHAEKKAHLVGGGE
jgi:transcriptional regulator with XRE-family HTH domain